MKAFRKQGLRGPLKNEKGLVLVVGLMMVSALALIGSTAVITSSTDLKISANYKLGNQAFYVAEAGVEEARSRMRANAGSPISDNHPTQTGWSAFIGAEAKAQGKGYSSGNVMHIRVASLQSALDYTVKIIHQTNAANQILYWGDANGDGLYERNTTTGENIYLVTGYGAAGSAAKTVAMEISRTPPVSAPAALYVKAPTTIQGTSTNVIGTDQCGGSDKPGIVTTLSASTVTASGNPVVCGSNAPDCTSSSSWDVVGGGVNVNVQAIIDSFKGDANFAYNTNSETVTGMNWGTPTLGATQQNPSTCSASNIVYYNTNDTYVKLAGGTTGCGVLIIDGDLEVNGSFLWNGLVIVSGSVTYLGGGDKNITGAVMAGSSVDADLVGGNANIVYCSSAVNNQTANRPLRKLSWQELF
jgi:Tfp pilus assembly protein PilX